MTPSPTIFAARTNTQQIEEGVALAPKFDDQGLIPVVAVDHRTNEVLMVAYMNAEALTKTLERREAVYYSRSRKKLWFKGEESGNVQKVKDILIDCDQDTLVLKVEQMGGACCHNGYRTCFYRHVKPAGNQGELEYTEKSRVFDPKQVYGDKSKKT